MSLGDAVTEVVVVALFARRAGLAGVCGNRVERRTEDVGQFDRAEGIDAPPEQALSHPDMLGDFAWEW